MYKSPYNEPENTQVRAILDYSQSKTVKSGLNRLGMHPPQSLCLAHCMYSFLPPVKPSSQSIVDFRDDSEWSSTHRTGNRVRDSGATYRRSRPEQKSFEWRSKCDCGSQLGSKAFNLSLIQTSRNLLWKLSGVVHCRFFGYVTSHRMLHSIAELRQSLNESLICALIISN